MEFYDKFVFGISFKAIKTNFHLKSNGGFVNASKVIKDTLLIVIHSCFTYILIVFHCVNKKVGSLRYHLGLFGCK